MSLKRKIPPSSGAVLTEAVARQLLLHAICTVPRADFRAWLENRENFRLRRFDMPQMGVCWVNYSGLTCAAGFGLWVDGFVQDDVGVWPAFGKHGFADCSLCRGAPHNEFSFGSNRHLRQGVCSFCLSAYGRGSPRCPRVGERRVTV